MRFRLRAAPQFQRLPSIGTHQYDSIFGALRGVAKASGVSESRDDMMDFFIDRVRSNLHCVLAMSPVGDTLRVRARRFPALINCTAIDWFHEWPKDALVSVASAFLEDVDLRTPEIKDCRRGAPRVMLPAFP